MTSVLWAHRQYPRHPLTFNADVDISGAADEARETSLRTGRPRARASERGTDRPAERQPHEKQAAFVPRRASERY